MKNMIQQLVCVPQKEAKDEILFDVITFKENKAFSHSISYIRKDYHEKLLERERSQVNVELNKVYRGELQEMQRQKNKVMAINIQRTKNQCADKLENLIDSAGFSVSDEPVVNNFIKELRGGNGE